MFCFVKLLTLNAGSASVLFDKVSKLANYQASLTDDIICVKMAPNDVRNVAMDTLMKMEPLKICRDISAIAKTLEFDDIEVLGWTTDIHCEFKPYSLANGATVELDTK